MRDIGSIEGLATAYCALRSRCLYNTATGGALSCVGDVHDYQECCRRCQGGKADAEQKLTPAVLSELSAIHTARVEFIASAALAVQTTGQGFVEITRQVARFLETVKARDGVVLIYLKHTSASLVIQENADPDVRTDLVTALERIAPADAGWIHEVEGPDDMPAHIKSMLNGVSLAVPVVAGKIQLGTWQGIYVAEHRQEPHRREVTLQFLGACEDTKTNANRT